MGTRPCNPHPTRVTFAGGTPFCSTLKKKLFNTFATLLALVGMLIGMALFSTSKLHDTVKWNTHPYQEPASSEKMLLLDKPVGHHKQFVEVPLENVIQEFAAAKDKAESDLLAVRSPALESTSTTTPCTLGFGGMALCLLATLLGFLLARRIFGR